MRNTKKIRNLIGWDSLDYGTIVIDNNTGQEWEVRYLHREFVYLRNLESGKENEFSWRDIEMEFDWLNK